MSGRGERLLYLLCICLFFAGGYRKYEEHKVQVGFQNKFLDHGDSSRWNMQEGEYAIVYYQGKKQEAEMTLHLADSYYPMVAQDFHWDRKEKLEFVLYTEADAMRKALRIQAQEDLPMGAYYGGAAAILSPSLWTEGKQVWEQTEEFIENGPVVHEMLHFAMDEKANGRYPHWFSEGVALYYEKKYTGFEWRADLKEESRAITMQELYHHFEELDPAMAYRKSYDWVRGYVQKNGEKALLDLIQSGKMCLSP